MQHVISICGNKKEIYIQNTEPSEFHWETMANCAFLHHNSPHKWVNVIRVHTCSVMAKDPKLTTEK